MADTTMQVIIELKDQISSSLKDVQDNLDNTKKSFQQTADASKTFAVGLAAVGAALGAAAFVGIKFDAQMETTRQGLITLLGSAEEADSTLARIKKEAARTPFEIAGLSSAVQLMASVTKNGDKAINVILDVGEGLAAMGKGQAELDRLIVNLQQIGAVGKASMLDIKQFAFAGIPIFEMLTETTGKSGQALGDLITNGGVTFELLTKMFDEANDAGGRFYGAFANQTGTLTQLWSNLKDTVNSSLGDLVKTSGLFDAIKVAVAGLNKVLPPFFETISKIILFLKENPAVFYVIAGAIVGALVPAIYSAAVAFASLMVSLAPFMLAGAVIAGIIAGIVWVVQNWELVKQKAVEIWTAIANFFKGIWDGITNYIGGVIDGMYQKIVTVFTAIKDFFSLIWDGIATYFKFVAALMVGGVLAIFELFGIDLQAVLTGIFTFFSEIWTQIKDWAISTFDSMTTSVGSKLDSFKAKWNSGWSAIKEYTGGKWSEIKRDGNEGMSYILETVGSYLKPVTEAFSKIWDSVKAAMDLAMEGIKSALKATLNYVLEKINTIIKSVNDVAAKGAGALGITIPKIPEIPLLAKGGIVTKPTLAMIGEAGPEAVVPLNKSGNNGMGGVTINITVNGDVTGEDLIERIGDALTKRMMLNSAIVG